MSNLIVDPVNDKEIGAIEHIDETGEVVTSVPFYMCGHCNTTILLRSSRPRPRVRCSHCSKLICEKTQICKETCTPVRDLALDKLEGRVARKYGTYLDATLTGVQTFAEVGE